MKAPKKNHQEAKFAKEKPKIKQESPWVETMRKIIFFSIVGGLIYFLYDFTFVRLNVEQTKKEIYEIEQSVRQLTPRGVSYNDTANFAFLFFNGHIGSDSYKEGEKYAKNRFGGSIVLQPENSGFGFSIEYAGVPEYVCKRVFSKDWGTSVTLDMVRIGGRTYSYEEGEIFPIPEADLNMYCKSRNFKFYFK